MVSCAPHDMVCYVINFHWILADDHELTFGYLGILLLLNTQNKLNFHLHMLFDFSYLLRFR